MNLKIARPSTEAQKTTQTTLDTWEITPDQAKSWKVPPFQRPLRVNPKVLEVAAQLKQGTKDDVAVIPGVFCIGYLDGERYLVDGQHRREAFLIADIPVGYVDVRIVHFDTMAEMAEEFVKLNSRLVNMKPDDIIRGLESSCPAIHKVRRACPYIGYENVRRNDRAPVLSMSTLLRCWRGSASEMPRTGGASAAQLATEFSEDDVTMVIGFLGCAFTAWGREESCARLWGTLNLSLCMWLYRRIVLGAHSSKTKRISNEQFTKCLMAVSAAEFYVDWLVGRNNLSPNNLSPAYKRIKGAFDARLEKDTGTKHLLPAPDWAKSGGKK